MTTEPPRQPFLRRADVKPTRPIVHLPSVPKRLLLAALVLLVAAGAVFGVFAWRVYLLQTRRAVGPSWSFPSRLYTDAVPLVGGMPLPREYVLAELEARGYRAVPGSPRPGQYVDEGDALAIGLRGFADARDPAGHGGPERVRVHFEGGFAGQVERLGGFRGGAPPDTANPPRLEPVVFGVLMDSSRVMRQWVPLARMPKILRQAAIASEDRRFASHHGIDPQGGVRALLVNLRAGGVREGASTITQQLARGLFLGSERTMGRKLQEMVLALALETVLPKDRILEMYLNSVYFGRDSHGGIAGVAEASERFFGVPVDSLTLPQAAMLVGVIPAPNGYSPIRNPQAAFRRRAAVLRDLLAMGVIDSVSAGEAAAAPLGIRPGRWAPERFPAYAGWLRQQVGRQLPKHALEGWGLSVFTTLDPAWQQIAEDEMRASLDAEDPRGSRGDLQGAFVLIEAATGSVRAMVGGRHSDPGEFNRAVQARRQPGSSIKPIVYSSALDPKWPGPRFTPGSTVADIRRTFGRGEQAWSPQNSSGRYHSRITLVKALCLSQNVATANLVDSLGPANVARAIERYGLGRPPAVLSLGLGSFEVAPLALVSAYSTFPNGGTRIEPNSVRALVDGANHAVRVSAPRADRLLDEDTAAEVIGMLRDVVRYGLSRPLVSTYGFDRPVGGKTGTTNDNRDAWYLGVTPTLAAGVWVGYDVPRPLPRAAAGMALPVWARIMRRALEGFPPTEFPQRTDVVEVTIDAYSGMKAGPYCFGALPVLFRAASAPVDVCNRDHTGERFQMTVQGLMDSLAAEAAADSEGAGPGVDPDGAASDTTGVETAH